MPSPRHRQEYWRLDPNSEFVVARNFTFDGKDLKPGQPFARTQCTTRLLRLLYEQRRIDVVQEGAQVVQRVPPPTRAEGARPSESVPAHSSSSVEEVAAPVERVRLRRRGTDEAKVEETIS
jgi:hypothetical protein